MFTGIVEGLGKVAAIEKRGSNLNSMRLTLESPLFKDAQAGDSIAINGICLTVETQKSLSASFYLSSETLEKSNLGQLTLGSLVNLERSAQVGGRNSGHWVQGHGDGTGRIESIESLSSSCQDSAWKSQSVRISAPPQILKYIVAKGSIAVDGISLTINSVNDRGFSVQIIPHTWENTRLKTLTSGDLVNLEVDILAKYVEKLCQHYPNPLKP